MAIDLPQIESEVRAAIDAVGASFRGRGVRNPVWTLQLKVNLSERASNLGFQAYASSCDPAAGGEWLYDMCWLLVEDGMIRDVPMVCESEWKRTGIEHDFQKLLLARAHLRVMVFETMDEAQTKGLSAKLKEQIRRCAQSTAGDRYLFAAWQAGESFVFESYCHQA